MTPRSCTVLWVVLGAAMLAGVSAIRNCHPRDDVAPLPIASGSITEDDVDMALAPQLADLHLRLEGYTRARRELGVPLFFNEPTRRGKGVYVEIDRGRDTETAVWRIRERDGRVSIRAGSELARRIDGDMTVAAPKSAGNPSRPS